MRKVRTTYQSFVAFQEPFVGTFCRKGVGCSVSTQRISKIVCFVHSNNHDPVFRSIIALGCFNNCKNILLVGVFYQLDETPYT